MADRITEALGFIKRARDQAIEAKYVFARDNYIKGLQLLSQEVQSQRYMPLHLEMRRKGT